MILNKKYAEELILTKTGNNNPFEWFFSFLRCKF